MASFFRVYCILLGLLLNGTVAASQSEIDRCFTQAAQYYSVEKALLLAVAKEESRFNTKAINDRNGNGTVDIGIMQINSWWKPILEKLGISWSRVKNDVCTNIHVGAWILATNFKSSGFNWQAIGAYNAGYRQSPSLNNKRRIYINKIKKAYQLALKERCRGREYLSFLE